MSTLELKFSIHNLLDTVNDKKALKAVYTFLQAKTKQKNSVDLWDTLSDEEKKSIEKGLDDIKHGRVRKHEDVMKDMRKKYKIKE